MSSDRKYDTLLNKYNILVAKTKDLQEQLDSKKDQWEKRDADFEITKKLAKDLCVKILSKNPKEMRLGKAYTWSSMSIDELIRKAMEFYDVYNEQRLKLMKELADTGEERLSKIESLEDQIDRMRNDPSLSIKMSKEELDDKIKRDKENEEAKNKMPVDDQKKTEDLDVKIASPTVALDENDGEMLDDFMDETAGDAPLTSSSMKLTKTENRKKFEEKDHEKKENKKNKSRKKNKRKSGNRSNSDIKIYSDLADSTKGWNDADWAVIKIIGDTGAARKNQITEKVKKEFGESISKRVTPSLASLTKNDVLAAETAKTYVSSMKVYKLGEIGKAAYEQKYDSHYAPSEIDILKSEHDNLEHGYGIRYVKEDLESMNIFKSVDDERRKHPIKFDNGEQYIPDIVCTPKTGNKTVYIEYECVNQTGSDLQKKLSKMTKVTDTLNFICPTKDRCEALNTIISKWISNRSMRSLNGIKVRVSSAKTLMTGLKNGQNFYDDETWQYVFNCGKSKDPKIN